MSLHNNEFHSVIRVYYVYYSNLANNINNDIAFAAYNANKTN